MLASVAGAVAGWSIFSVVTVDVATKNKRVIKMTNINQEVPQFNWYFVKKTESDRYEATDEEEALIIGTDWINQQTPIYCDEKIINFKNYWKLPLFRSYSGAGVIWINNPFILKHTEKPKAWYCVSKTIWRFSSEEWYAYYDLFYHPFYD